jgi:hypothetical protein
MKVYCGPRQCGKTTELAKLAQKNPAVIIVCHSEQEAERLIKHFKLSPRQVVTYARIEDLRHLRSCDPMPRIYFDNIELFLRELASGYEIGGITATAEPVFLRPKEANTWPMGIQWEAKNEPT